jgi:hypothetical protein
MTTVIPPHRETQDRWHKVFSRPWRIPRRTNALAQVRVDSPRRIAQRRHRIRIERAVCLIARTACSTSAALRSVGLEKFHATEVVRTCDERGIARRHWWGTPYPIMTEVNTVHYVKPRAG